MTAKKEWLNVFRELAARRGGQCLSDRYVNQKTALEFECELGHRWSALPNNVYHKGSWCPECAGNAKLSIGDIQAAAQQLGCQCLSTKYLNFHAPMEFICAMGHPFTASAASVKHNEAACMECQKLELSEFQRLCDSLSYTLISTQYVNNYTHIRVLCDVGHTWDVQPKHFKEGRRCPECRRSAKT